jgi:DNA-binding NarL/FixJ family response regulator
VKACMACEERYQTYVIARNRLAGEYLVHLLADDRLIAPVLCDHVANLRPETGTVVFVVDGSFIPIGECVRRLTSRYPQARFVVVGNPRRPEEIVILLREGVHGFVEYSQVAATLRDSVQQVATGLLWVPREVLSAYVEQTSRTNRCQSAGNKTVMTPREVEVVEFVRLGLSNKEIGSILGVQESTVKFHLSNIFEKLHIRSRDQLGFDQRPAFLWDQLFSA